MPWGHGIHQCPGKPVAVMSAKGIVHTLLQHFSILSCFTLDFFYFETSYILACRSKNILWYMT